MLGRKAAASRAERRIWVLIQHHGNNVPAVGLSVRLGLEDCVGIPRQGGGCASLLMPPLRIRLEHSFYPPIGVSASRLGAGWRWLRKVNIGCRVRVLIHAAGQDNAGRRVMTTIGLAIRAALEEA